MSDLTASNHEPGHIHDVPSHAQAQHLPTKHHDRIASISGLFLERGDSIIYAIVGVCFFLGAIFALGYSFWDFGSTIFNVQVQAKALGQTDQAVVANAIIKLVSDLLLVLIIMEVLGTVIHYLRAHATSLRPFLFIGMNSYQPSPVKPKKLRPAPAQAGWCPDDTARSLLGLEH